jgi:hypothetical protein
MKIPSIDKLADTKRIRKAALAIVKAKTFKEGYSYSVTQGRLQGQYTCIRRSLATREIIGVKHTSEKSESKFDSGVFVWYVNRMNFPSIKTLLKLGITPR